MPDNRPQARIEFNDLQGRRVVRIDRDMFTIGRRTGQDLQINGNEVSRDHAAILFEGGHYAIKDLDSRFGTFVNGERVKQQPLQHLDRIRFGNCDPELTFFITGDGSVERTADLAVGDLRQISSLLEGLRAVGTRRVLDDVLALVLDSAIDVSGAERGFIMLATENGILEFKRARSRGRAQLDGKDFNTSRKIPDQVFQTGRPQFMLDMLGGDFDESHGATIAMGIRHVLCVPLSLTRFMESSGDAPVEERRLGVLYLDSKEHGVLNSPVTSTALEALAREAAVAIENTRLYREAIEKSRMEQELRIAAEMQQALLPARRRMAPNYEAVGAMVACLAIGGDFFDYFDLPGGRSGFVLCDVSGKGAPAALMTAMIQGVFRALAEDKATPAETMARVNRVLSRRAVASRYATCFYAILGPEGHFASSNGGHNPPIVARRDGTFERLTKGGMPIGMFAKAAYDEEEIVLQPGDTVLLFSDGLSEAVNPEGEEYGDDRLIESLAMARDQEPDTALNMVFSRAKEFAGLAPQSDDMTALIVRFREPSVR